MVGLILKIYLAWKLGSAAHRTGVGNPNMTASSWWLWILGGMVAEWVLLNVKYLVDNPNSRAANQGEIVAVAIALITIFVMVPSLICWLIGRWKRPKLLTGHPSNSLHPPS